MRSFYGFIWGVEETEERERERWEKTEFINDHISGGSTEVTSSTSNKWYQFNEHKHYDKDFVPSNIHTRHRKSFIQISVSNFVIPAVSSVFPYRHFSEMNFIFAGWSSDPVLIRLFSMIECWCCWHRKIIFVWIGIDPGPKVDSITIVKADVKVWLKSNCFTEEIPLENHNNNNNYVFAEVRERGHNHSHLVIPHAFWMLFIAKWLNRNILSLSSSSLYDFLCSIHYIIRWMWVCVSTASTRRQPDHHIPKQRRKKKKSERC